MSPHSQVGRGDEPVRTFFGQLERSIFRDFVQTSFIIGPLHCRCHNVLVWKHCQTFAIFIDWNWK